MIIFIEIFVKYRLICRHFPICLFDICPLLLNLYGNLFHYFWYEREIYKDTLTYVKSQVVLRKENVLKRPMICKARLVPLFSFVIKKTRVSRGKLSLCG